MSEHQPSASDVSAIVDLIPGRVRDLGGFSVRRVLPIGHRKMVGPFIFFDHMGPVALAPGAGMDVRPHPHIGLATVTYLFEGRIMHRDSLGNAQMIEPGAVNWMTAGRGIVHSERSAPEDRVSGVRMHGIQSWVALPVELEEAEPAFVHHPAASLPSCTVDGVQLTIIAGSAYGQTSPVATASPTLYVDAQMAANTTLDVPTDATERAVYAVDSAIEVTGTPLPAGTMAVLAPGAPVRLHTSTPARVMLIGGEPLGPERLIWWNFVSSRAERVEQAKRDWKAGNFPAVPGEHEFIPLPEG